MPIDPRNLPHHDTVLDVTGEQIARTYADALLGAAVGNEREVVGQLQGIVTDVLDPHPEFIEPLRSAFLSHEERVDLIDRVFGGRVSDVTLNFLKVLSKHNRLGILRSVAVQATRLWEESNDNVRVRVFSAEPLDEGLIGEIDAMLRAKTGKEPILSVSVDPDLIAGVQIHVGDRVYDGSLKTCLEKARQAIISHTIERIEQSPEHFLSTN
jgi:F-type H+-transporting ATPase subunit delta